LVVAFTIFVVPSTISSVRSLCRREAWTA
jgi:hypothetical protein